MKITFINASPKAKGSNTANFIQCFLPRLSEHKTEVITSNKEDLTETEYEKMTAADVLVFAFPLYIDSLPSNLLWLLSKLENIDFDKKNKTVYCMINNGFFEGTQNRIACEIIKNWCSAAGFQWGQGIGIGAGEMSPTAIEIPLDKGPLKPLDSAFTHFSDNILHKKSAENIFVSPRFPRILWIKAAEYTFWLPKAKVNGLKRKDIYSMINNLK